MPPDDGLYDDDPTRCPQQDGADDALPAAESTQTCEPEATVSGPRKSAEPRQRVRRRMVVASQRYTERTRAEQLQQRAHLERVAADQNWYLLAWTTDETEAEAHLELRWQNFCAWRRAHARISAAQSSVSLAHDEFNQSMYDLSLAIDESALSEDSSPATQDLLKAARHMLGGSYWIHPSLDMTRRPRYSADGNANQDQAESTVQSAEQAALWRSELVSILKVITSAGPFAKPLTQAIKEFDRINGKPDVPEPVRPTQEEVTRFLAELERFMTDRQRSHRGLPPLMDEQLALQQALNGLPARLKALRDLLVQNRDPRLAEQREFSMSVVSDLEPRVKVALESIKESRPCKGLDMAMQPTASRRENKHLGALRVMMRDTATAMGKVNEATAALNSAKAGVEKSVQRDDLLVSCGSWQDCLPWHEKKESAEKDAARFNKSRQTKLELLQESVAKYVKERDELKAEMAQYLGCMIPEPEDPVCDSLRALINGACWMVNGLIPKGKRGHYPQY